MDDYLQLQRFKKAKNHLKKGDKLLDIGCEKCRFFDYVSDIVTDCIGIDPAQYDIEMSSKIEPKILRGLFPQVLAEDAKFDAITMLAVLEHIQPDDQIKVAKGVTKHLNIGGRLIITVPDARVDKILEVLQKFGVVDADTLDEHYGYDINKTQSIFENEQIKMKTWKKFQLGLNNLFVFEKVK